MFVLGSSTGPPKTPRRVVSSVFCEDLPVWGWSTPALKWHTIYRTRFYICGVFSNIYTLCIYLNIRDNTVKSLALVYTLCNKWVLKILCFIFYFYVSRQIAYWSVCLSWLCQKSSRLSKNCAKMCTCVIYLIIALRVNTADRPCFCTHPLTNQSHLGCLPYFCAQRVLIAHWPSEKFSNFLNSAASQRFAFNFAQRKSTIHQFFF